MSLTVKATGGSFELAPAGTHIARCYRIVDLGTQTSVINGETKSAPKIALTWELLGDQRMTDGRPFVISKWYTASLHDRSNLRKALEAWRGKPFDESELDGFDVSKILGSYCLLQVQQVVKNNQDRDEIVALMALPKGTPKPAPINDIVVLNFDNFDFQVFDTLPNGTREKIAASPEFKKLGQPANPGTGAATGGDAFADFDDDVVF